MATARRFAAVVIIAVLAAGCAPARAAGPHTITLTLVRHAQSAGNASGLIDTSTPGPELTAKGWCQATLAAGQLSPNHYDGIYASSMIRTQQTAMPMAQALAEPVSVLPGLREIEAGQYEGQPESSTAQTWLVAPQRWLHGDRSARIPGAVDGIRALRSPCSHRCGATNQVCAVLDSGWPSYWPASISRSPGSTLTGSASTCAIGMAVCWVRIMLEA